MKIMFWLADRQGPGYYRCILPGVQLANQGHKVALDETMPESIQAGGADVIVGQRVCQPGASETWQALAKAGHTKLVFETDDLLTDVEASNKQAARFFTGEMVERYVANMRVADLVTVSTPALAEECAKVNPNVMVLPNQIPSWLLTHDVPRDDNRVTIGWRGGNSHARDFGELARPLKRVLQRHGDAVELNCVGYDYTPRVASIKGRTRHTPWTSGVADYLKTIDFDIGVVPLRPSVFNDSKSELALLELSALGIPAIVSDTGPYARAIAAGAPALAATDHKSWEQHLNTLIGSAEDRAQLGKAAREWAAGRTIEANAHLWAEAYES